MTPVNEIGTVSDITIFPIKSLDGESVSQAEVLPNGGLKFDRQYSFFNKDTGVWIRAKQYPELIRIRSEFNLLEQSVRLNVNDKQDQFQLEEPNGRDRIGEWMSDYLKESIELKCNEAEGYFDDLKRGRWGISLIATSTLEKVASWFPDLTPKELKRRLRMNIEVGGVSEFWEEAIIRKNRTSNLKIGNAIFPDPWLCSRCSVTTRNSITSEAHDSFTNSLTEFRSTEKPHNAHLINASDSPDFKGFYSLGVRLNGLQKNSNNFISMGDKVSTGNI